MNQIAFQLGSAKTRVTPASRRKVGVFALGLLAFAGRAEAVTCPTSGWSADVPVKLTVEAHPNVPGQNKYVHNQDYLWYLSVGPAVADIRVRWQRFNIENSPGYPPQYDYFAHIGGPYYENMTYYDGNLTGLWTGGWGAPAPAQKYWLLWHTDPDVSIINGEPYADKVQVRCYPGRITAQPFAISLQSENQGILYDTGKTVHFYVDVPAGRKLFLTLDGYPGSADFDLYADTSNQLPDYTAQWTSTTFAANEAIYTSTFASTTRVYVTVKSFSGQGSFVLHAYSPTSIASRKVCAQQQVGPVLGSAWNLFVEDLERTSLRMLQATNGNLFVETWNVHQIPLVYGSDGLPKKWCNEIDPSCEVCVGHPLSEDPCGNQSVLGVVRRMPGFSCPGAHASDWQAVINVHEEGHSKLGLYDDYNWCGEDGINHGCPSCGCGAFCGHGLMNGPLTHVFCTGSSSANNRHCLDGLPGVTKNPDIPTPCTYPGSNWYKLSQPPFNYQPPPGPNPDASYDLVFNASALSRVFVPYYNL